MDPCLKIDPNKSNINSHIDSDIFIRRMTDKDITDLIKICCLSFPDSLKWHGPTFYARRWWKTRLEMSSSETWVCLLGGHVAGFLILVTDISQHKKEKRTLSLGPLFVLCAFVTCPKLFIKKIARAISMAISTKDTQDSYARGADALSWSTITRVELIAVAPDVWGKGLGTRMLEFSMKRASELRCKTLELLVGPSNKRAARLYEKAGFEKTARSKSGLTYTKVICEPPESDTVESIDSQKEH